MKDDLMNLDRLNNDRLNNDRPSNEMEPQSAKAPKARKLYRKPAFRHERVFETQALSCGKTASVSFTCQPVTSQKSS